MKLINKLFFTKHYRSENTTSCMFISSRFKGFGFMLDVDPLQADRYRQFVFEIKLFYFNFWIIKYENKNLKK